METAQVSQTISPNDTMFEADHRNLDLYLRNGASAVQVLKRYCDAPSRILDFGCGHGRVLRHIVSEWPEAEVTACDLDAHGVEFCKRTFGVRGIHSAVAPDFTLPRFDLIWVGSVFSHLEPVAWRGFLKLLADSLDDVIALSLVGAAGAEDVRGGADFGLHYERDGLLADFDATGFAYRDLPYGRRKGYGLALVSPEAAERELTTAGLRMVAHEPGAWMKHDVAVASVG